MKIYGILEKFDISSSPFYGIMYLVMLKWETVVQKEKRNYENIERGNI